MTATIVLDDPKMAEEPSFCEEILRVIITDSELIVLDYNAQWIGQNLQGRSVIPDAKCQLCNGKVVNIEVQKGRMKRLHLIRLYAIKIILFYIAMQLLSWLSTSLPTYIIRITVTIPVSLFGI